MADVTDFYPGGAAGNPVPHSTTADQVDDNNVATGLHFWSGTQADYDAIAAAEAATPGTHPNFARTIYYTI